MLASAAAGGRAGSTCRLLCIFLSSANALLISSAGKMSAAVEKRRLDDDAGAIVEVNKRQRRDGEIVGRVQIKEVRPGCRI